MLPFGEYDHSGIKIFNLSGHLDAHCRLDPEALVSTHETTKCHHVILNVSEVTWIDLGGLGQIFVWYHNLKSKNIRLSLVNPQPMVYQLLEAANLPELVPIYHSVPEAMRGFAASSLSFH